MEAPTFASVESLSGVNDMEKQLDKLLLALSHKGVKDYDILFTEDISSPIIYEQNELQELQETVDRGYGLRVLKDGKLGFASTNRLIDVDTFVEDALSTAKFGEKVSFRFPGSTSIVDIASYDDTGWDETSRINLGKEVLKSIMEDSAQVKVDVHLEYARRNTRLLNSRGLDLTHRNTFYYLGVSGFVILETGFAFVYEEASGARPLEDPMGILSQLKEKLRRAKKLARIERADMPVILAPFVLPSLLIAFEIALNGKNVAKGISPLSGKIGEDVLSREFSIYENPLKPYGWGSTPFDAEGVPTKSAYLIERGVLKEYVLDLYSSGKLNLPSNGHAKRDYSSMPVPGVHGLEIPTGDKSLSELLDEDSFLFVDDVIGAGQSNLLAGDFSLNVGLGYVIKRGEVIGRIKDTMISGNVYDVFKRPLEASLERKTFRGYAFPYMRLEGIKITSKSIGEN